MKNATTVFTAILCRFHFSGCDFSKIKYAAVALLMQSCNNSNQIVDHVVMNEDVNIVNSSSSDIQIHYRDSLLKPFNKKKYFNYSVLLQSGEYSVEVKTYCLNDTLPDENTTTLIDGVFPLVTRPVIIEQNLIFRHKKIEHRRYKIPFKTITRTNNVGKKINCLEQNAWVIFSIKSMKDTLYGLAGTGLCMVGDCPEFIGFYTRTGKVLFEIAGSQKENKGQSYNTILRQFGKQKESLQYEIKNGVRIDTFWRGMRRELPR